MDGVLEKSKIYKKNWWIFARDRDTWKKSGGGQGPVMAIASDMTIKDEKNLYTKVLQWIIPNLIGLIVLNKTNVLNIGEEPQNWTS